MSLNSDVCSVASEDRAIADQPKVCQVVPSINERTGGTAPAVTHLAIALTQQQIESHILTLDYRERGAQLPTDGIHLHSYPAPLLARRLRGFHPPAKQALLNLAIQHLDVIHSHGLWMFPNLYAREVAQRKQIPLIISPHGMVESWALGFSRSRKQWAWRLYEQRNFVSATAFHATSSAEATSIRQLGFQQPIAIVPDGVHVPDLDQVPAREQLTQRFPELRDRRWLLFMSRLHPKKGLETLLQVWHSLASRFPDWQLVIAGPDQFEYMPRLKALVTEFNLEASVSFVGMLSGDDKAAALGHADLFILPTHSENFGIAIAEALSYGVPAITTTGAPWQDLETHHCGWWVNNTPDAIAIALTEAMQHSTPHLKVLGQNGRQLIERKYTWDAIARSMSDVYRWLSKGGVAPDCVQFVDPIS